MLAGDVQANAKACLARITETSQEGAAVILTVSDQKQVVTVEQLSTMPLVDFAKLYTVGPLSCIQQ